MTKSPAAHPAPPGTGYENSPRGVARDRQPLLASDMRQAPPRRSPELDADGRFGWTIEVNGQAVKVLMSGIDGAVLRHIAPGQQVGGFLPGEVPALQVNGAWAWWPTAAMWAVPLPAKP